MRGVLYGCRTLRGGECSVVSGGHPHVAVRVRCFDIRNVPNPRPVFTPVQLWGQVIGHRKGGRRLTAAGEEFLFHFEGVQAKRRREEEDPELVGAYHQLGAVLLQCPPGSLGQIRTCDQEPSQFTEVWRGPHVRLNVWHGITSAGCLC